MRVERLFPLGVFGPDGEDVRHFPPKTFIVQRMSDGNDRLRIGVVGLTTLRSLLTLLPPPYWVLYVLIVPAAPDTEAGRYQSPSPLGREEFDSFLDRYGPFLESDGRHDLWIKSVNDPELLVYDRHEIVYAYGDLDRLRTVLEVEGYVPGEVAIPNPHSHHYHRENNEDQRRLFESYGWVYMPLRPDDEP